MSSITRNTVATTVFTSATGTICVGPTAGSASLPYRAVLAGLAALALNANAPPPADLTVSVSGLRDARGMVMLCLTRRADFLACDKDPARVTRIVPAGKAAAIDLAALPPGDWSLLAIHDANQNGKLDTLMGIPREGFAFSRNPVVRFGPPRLEQVRFALPEGDCRQALTMKYLL